MGRRAGAEERCRIVRDRRRTDQGRGRPRHQGHRWLHAVHRRPLRRQGHHPRPGLRVPAGRGPAAERLRPDLHRPPDHNLYHGNMAKWADYYERLFNFREIRYFDIKGAKTGLLSKAMTAPDGMVRIPLNESSDPKSQINEYLDAYKGEGIQHIACFTDDIYGTIEAMRAAGVEFLD